MRDAPSGQGSSDEKQARGTIVRAESVAPAPDSVAGENGSLGDVHPFRRRGARGWLYRYMLLVVLGLFVAIFSLLAPETFPTFGNLRTILATQASLVIVTLGLTFPLAAGEFDLSFGAVLGLCSTLTAVLTVNNGWDLLPAIAVVILTAATIGAVNGFFAVRLGINSLVVTIGTGTVLAGLTLAVSHNQVIAGASKTLISISTGTLFGIPYPVFGGFVLTALVWYVYEFTPLGRYIYFIGEGHEVARLAGIPVKRIKFGSLIAVALFAAVAGILLLGRLGSADPNIGATFMLPGFATVFLGSTTIRPGRFNAWGTLLAVYLLVVGITGLQLLGGAGWLEQVFNGSALVLAVTFARIVRKRREE